MSYPEIEDMAEWQEGTHPISEEAELQLNAAEYLGEINEVLTDPSKANEFAQKLALKDRDLKRLAERDPLTQLLNRRGFETEFNKLLRRFRRSLEEKEMKGEENATASLGSILFIDLDHFSQANENTAKGAHDFGDQVLKEVTKIIGDSLRPDDIVYRFGGEEIVVVLPECNMDNAVGAAERTRKDVYNQTLGGYVQTVSIGVAEISTEVTLDNIDSLTFLGDDGIIEWVRKGANEAMYFAKDSGRNKTAFKTNAGVIGAIERNPNGNGTTIRYKGSPSK